MLTLYLSESYAKKDLLLVRLRPSVANAIIGTELILLTLLPGTSSLRADPTFLLPSRSQLYNSGSKGSSRMAVSLPRLFRVGGGNSSSSISMD